MVKKALRSLKDKKSHLTPELLPEEELMVELTESNKKLEVIGKQIAFNELTAYQEE